MEWYWLIVILLICVGSVMFVRWCDRRMGSSGSDPVWSSMEPLVYEKPRVVQVTETRDWGEC